MEITNQHQLEDAKNQMKEKYFEAKKLIEKLPPSEETIAILKDMEKAMLEEGIEL